MPTWKKVITESDDSNYKNSNVDATDIDASVSNTEFGYLNGLTATPITELSEDISPVCGGTIDTSVGDICVGGDKAITFGVSGGLNVLQFTKVTHADPNNWITINNAENNTAPEISMLSSEGTNVGLTIRTKGSGQVLISNNGGDSWTLPAGEGSSGEFLSYDGSWATPAYATNTDVDVSVANLKTRLAEGFGSNAVQIGDSNDVVTIGNDLVVTGDLTVSGATTTVNTETINLADNAILLNSNESGTPSQDGGITIERGTSSNQSLFWDESVDAWCVGHTESSNEFTMTGVAVMSNAQTYSGSQALVNGYGGVGHIQIDGTDIYIRTS